jgi:hypothetical protein
MAAGKPKIKTKTKPIAVVCTTDVGIMIAPGDTAVVPPAAEGSEYGSASCGKLGKGVQSDAFTVPDSGDSLATYTMYFPTGTIRGAYDLVPQEGSFMGTNFTEVDSLGTLTVTGGTGVFQGAKGTGTMTCKTLDGIHTSCTDKLKLTKLPSLMTTVKK